MANVPNGEAKLLKISTGEVGCTNVTDNGQTDCQTTDRTAIAYSEREREFTFAKNGSCNVTTPISGTVSYL